MNNPSISIFTKSRSIDRKPGIKNGFTLVELMIAMTLSLVLLAGVVQIFVSSKQTYRTQEENSRLQESGRTATTLLQRDIRPAGFQGCRSISGNTPSVTADLPLPDFNADGDGSALTSDIGAATVIRGYEASSGNWTPTLPAALGTVTSNTDVIAIQRARNCGANLIADMSTTSSDLQISFPNACSFTDSQVLVISNCSSLDIFRATKISNAGSIQTIEHDTSLNGSASLSATYNIDADVMGFSSLTYFIATGTDGQPSLWRFDDTSAAVASVNPIELISNVADMQIEYGQDTAGDSDQAPNFYVTADNVTDWAAVVSVRISLLVQTQSNTVATQAQTYTYNRASVTAPDRRLYRVFTTTILLRNKVT